MLVPVGESVSLPVEDGLSLLSSSPLSEVSGAGQVLTIPMSIQILGILIGPIRLVRDGRLISSELISGRLSKATLRYKLSTLKRLIRKCEAHSRNFGVRV